ncbi:hypothetical protein [uncultured Bifidobacterium sp.]|uniref:hypothetical protein n=1 Tax=uncultured Bifidobacterium sp. TaxID=165187 RepID=UPI0026196797|nr:hypothetical protein [uncultured Bifidobacterium sp.]
MGSNYAETRNFTTRFKKSLEHVASLWNATLVDAGKEGNLRYSIEKGGLRLYRSPLSIVPKPKRPEPTQKPANGGDNTIKPAMKPDADTTASAATTKDDETTTPALTTDDEWNQVLEFGDPLEFG